MKEEKANINNTKSLLDKKFNFPLIQKIFLSKNFNFNLPGSSKPIKIGQRKVKLIPIEMFIIVEIYVDCRNSW